MPNATASPLAQGLLDDIEPDGFTLTVRTGNQALFDSIAARQGYAASAHWFPNVRTILLQEESTGVDRLGSFLHELAHAILGHGPQAEIDQAEHDRLTVWADAAAALFAVSLLPGEPIRRSWHREALERLGVSVPNAA